MKLRVEWSRPIGLKHRAKEDMVYGLDLSKITRSPGVYIFGRRWGSSFEALYVGKANSLRGRIRAHLNNLRLMQHLRDAKTGRRILLAGKLLTRGGQRLDKCLTLAERALIRYFLSEGHDLVNKQGTRIRRHELTSEGQHPKRFFPGLIYVEKARRE